MSEKPNDNNTDYLSSDEQAFVLDGGMERAGRVIVSQAAAKLAVELCVAPTAGGEFVQAFRNIEMREPESLLESSLEIASAIDHLRAVLARRGAAIVRSAALAAVIDEGTVSPSITERMPTSTAGNDDVRTEPLVLEESIVRVEAQDDSETFEAIKLSPRAQRYLRAIFGSLDDMALQEDNKATIVNTITRLRGNPKGGHEFVDMTPRILMMFEEGVKDADIAEQVNVTPASVATSFSNLVKKIKSQPGFSYASARLALEGDLERAAQRSGGSAGNETVAYEEDATVDDETTRPVQVETPEFKQTLQTGQLVGAIRRYLRKAGHDQTITLDETVLIQSIDNVFVANETIAELKQDYLIYLAKGMKPFGNSPLNECIATMHEYVAKLIIAADEPSEQRSNVLPITTPTHHPKVASVTPLNMPQRHSVLPFVAPQSKAVYGQKPVAHREVVNGGSIEETPLLITAAYREEVMSHEVWYKMAHEQIQASARSLQLSDEETEALWNTVHFSGKRKDGERRSTAAREAVKRLEERMIDRADRLAEYPEVERCMKMLLNNFSPNDLMTIQYALKKDNPTVYERAAQRYVVAGISELTRE